jgi:hypothetical protein
MQSCRSCEGLRPARPHPARVRQLLVAAEDRARELDAVETEKATTFGTNHKPIETDSSNSMRRLEDKEPKRQGAARIFSPPEK